MSSLRLYRTQTPIEEYGVSGRKVFVKREDLYGVLPAPPLGKLRGVRELLDIYYKSGVRLVGCWDTRVSRLGEGLAAASADYPRLRVVVSFPTRKGCSVPPSILAAQRLGAEVLPIRGNHVSICFSQVRRQVEARGGMMIPFGMECQEAVCAVAREASRIPTELSRGTVILCCGSGVTMTGLLMGLPSNPHRLIGVSSGRSITKIKACVLRYIQQVPTFARILPPFMPYDEVPKNASPFPSHPNYDLKAWQLLTRRITRLRDPILFWNIGA